MSQNKMIEDIVREVMRSMHQAPHGGAVAAAVPTKGFCPAQDYPLAEKHPDLVKTPGGKSLNDITLDKVLGGMKPADFDKMMDEAIQKQPLAKK